MSLDLPWITKKEIDRIATIPWEILIEGRIIPGECIEIRRWWRGRPDPMPLRATPGDTLEWMVKVTEELVGRKQ